MLHKYIRKNVQNKIIFYYLFVKKLIKLNFIGKYMWSINIPLEQLIILKHIKKETNNINILNVLH